MAGVAFRRTGRGVRRWLLIAALLPATACDGEAPARHAIPGADSGTGGALIVQFGCGACHRVPGIRGAIGLVGPPLDAWGRRTYVAGRVGNTPENLVRWLLDPPSIDPETAMPNLGLSEAEARHVAAYLYTLR